MTLSINPERITGLPNGAKATIVHVDGHNFRHMSWLARAYRKLLGYEAQVHGAGLTGRIPPEVIKAVKANVLKVQFLMVGKELAGIATSADIFTARRNNKTNKIEIVPAVYAEDTCVDPRIALAFRKLTRTRKNPKGIGLGTLFTRERIWRSVTGVDGFAPHGEVSGARICEVAEDNEPIAAIIVDKFGGTIGSTRDSRILELNDNVAPPMQPKFGVNVETLHLPSGRHSKKPCPNNFAIKWSSANDSQEIVGIYTRTVSTFTGEPIVRLQLTSNGNLPDSGMLKEVIASMLSAGRSEISTRGWGLPIGEPVPALGGSIPVIRIHASKEPEIVQALIKMGAQDRKCGAKTMVAAVMGTETIPDQQEKFGQTLPEVTKVDGVNPVSEAQKPYFSFVKTPSEFIGQQFDPTRPFGDGHYKNDNAASHALRAA